jgi:hypothetical protein
MAIKRYWATADNTITNAYLENLTIRATGSNMGAADILEVFSIYGQSATASVSNAASSSELSRFLIKFPVTGTNSIESDRTATTIPASGSVNFYLRMFNAPHSQTTPRASTLSLRPITSSWQEGTGMDMFEYKDLVNNNDGSNWVQKHSGDNWTRLGGDYHTGSNYTVYLDKGTEDIEVDITHLVEEWVDGSTIPDFGLGVMLTASLEASSSDNLTGSTNSYYTKKFFGRTSEYFFKRPYIEARWDSRTKDERGNIYFSSSLMTADENINTIYFYNYFRGQLRNVPDLGTGVVYASLFSGSSDDTEPSGDKLELHKDGTHVDDTSKTAMTGGYVSTGIYSASFCLTSSSAAPQTYYDVWWKTTTEYHTGSFTATRLKASNYNPDPTHVTSITNLRPEYNRRESSSRFRLFIREKDWSPTIYTKASTAILNTTIESASFRVHRVIDNLEAIPYGTGSTLHTLLSYDVSGNYLDLDMSVLEGGYAYGLKFAYYNGAVNQWVEQPETFKFRVEDVED